MKRLMLVLALVAALLPIATGCGGNTQEQGKVTVTGTEGYAPGVESPAPPSGGPGK